MKKQLVAGLTGFVLACSLLSPGISFADNIDDKKEDIKDRDKEIQRIEKEKKQTKKDLESVLKELEQRKRELNELNQDVYETEQKLEKSKKRVAEKEKQIEEQKKVYNERIRIVYRQGKMFYVRSLMNAKNLDDFLKRLEFVRLVAKRDQELINGYKTDRRELVKEKKQMEDLLAERKEKAEKAKGLHADLTGDYKKIEKQVKKLGSKQENLEEINEKEKKRIRDLIRKRQREQATEDDDGSDSYTGGKFGWPVKGSRITSTYGMRFHPVRKRYKMHTGVDFAGSLGTPIHAAAGGKVIESRPATGYGYIVIIDHGNGLSTLYAHMYAQGVRVQSGDSVSKGQVIAEIGNNGWSTGPHLHFEVLKNGDQVNPMSYLK
ncbi:murein hydrolase activator EnvC family protein [Salinithrix halophila]|uniref:Murein hydrolase activator EnvC family protein n=1 Tax=Salinithrix halophila TaxID=1485204 RepID=A0ABV8JEV3_9BACL